MTNLDAKTLKTLLNQRFDQQGKLINTAFQAQKNHLDDKLAKLEVRMDDKLEKLETRLDSQITTFKDEILTSNDKLAVKLDRILKE